MSHQQLPVNWTSVAQAESRSAAEQLTEIPSADDFGTMPGAFSASALLGPSRVKFHAASYAPPLAQTIGLLDPKNMAHWQEIADAALLANVLEIHGVPVSPQVRSQLEERLDQLSEVVDDEEGNEFLWQAAAFASLAFRRADLVLTFTGEPLPRKVKPGKEFEIDLQGLLAYFAAATEKQCGFEVIETAWLNHLIYFPLLRAADAAHWTELAAVARTAHGYCGGLPVDEIGGTLHKNIMQLIGAGL
jgi:hypothetical protein